MGIFARFRKKKTNFNEVPNASISLKDRFSNLGKAKKKRYTAIGVILFKNKPIGKIPMEIEGYSSEHARSETNKNLSIKVEDIYQKK